MSDEQTQHGLAQLKTWLEQGQQPPMGNNLGVHLI